jgi:integral membrane sensor domain MASE1
LPVAMATIVATIIANVLNDRTIWAAIAKCLCNAGEALVIAGLIDRSFGPHFNLDRLTNVLGLVAAAIVATLASGPVGTAAIKLLHSPTGQLVTIWYDWFATHRFRQLNLFDLRTLVNLFDLRTLGTSQPAHGSRGMGDSTTDCSMADHCRGACLPNPSALWLSRLQP